MRSTARDEPAARGARGARAPRDDLRPARAAAGDGERATTVYANPRQIVDPARGRDRRRPRARARAREALSRCSPTTRAASSTCPQGRSGEGGGPQAAGTSPGIGFYPEERRTYPQKTVASEVVGYAGTDNTRPAGLELKLDKVLAGQRRVEDGRPRPVRPQARRRRREAVKNGRDVYLTIDNTLQRQVEQILERTRANWAAKAATAVVMDARTGGILALGVEPGFDANKYPHVSREGALRNRAVTDTYEPGSTFKVVTLAGVLETGLVTPADDVHAAVLDPGRRPRHPRRGLSRDADG